jgi:hypothetical protein
MYNIGTTYVHTYVHTYAHMYVHECLRHWRQSLTTYPKVRLDCPGGVEQWTPHTPEELQTRVRFPPGYKVFREIIATQLFMIDLICIVCVLKKEKNVRHWQKYIF